MVCNNLAANLLYGKQWKVVNRTMSRVTVYSTGRCPTCDKTKRLLSKWNIAYDEVLVDQDRSGLIEMSRITNGARTVPQITIDQRWIGSLIELTELHMDGELDQLMNPDKTAGE